MKIDRQVGSAGSRLVVQGRLDAYWADHLAAAIEESLREGGHRLQIDMAEVAYMSSAGIRILLRFRKQLNQLGGSFLVVNPSEAVLGVLRMVGLESLLRDAPESPVAQGSNPGELRVGDMRFEVLDEVGGEPLLVRLLGNAGSLEQPGAAPVPLLVQPSTLAVGVGFLGEESGAASDRSGELLAAGGAIAYLPCDGTGVPDYLVSAGDLHPRAQALYALSCELVDPGLLRFATDDPNEALGLNALAEGMLTFSGAAAAAVVMVAESSGLMGVALRQAPAPGPGGDRALRFDFPEVRNWLSFAPERVFARSLVLLVGIVCRQPADPLAAMVRPLGGGSELFGHFHAAAFPYRPLRKGRIDLTSTVRGLFDDGAPMGLLHLLNDDRPIVGSGDSLFARGACWVAPVGGVRLE